MYQLNNVIGDKSILGIFFLPSGYQFSLIIVKFLYDLVFNDHVLFVCGFISEHLIPKDSKLYFSHSKYSLFLSL